ncbi:hypothetical protein AB0F96_04080 [Streptomyces sp. NPDC023998]|uniref:hypothetical protein n=1 Tax=Streptomyces sp. NPDC023998 TaxID=3154597 RepID=UPI0033E065DD
MAKAIVAGQGTRRKFSFWTDYRDHDVFEVSLMGRDDREPFVYPVRSWGAMVVSVRTFTDSIGASGESTRGTADIYRTGYALVNGFNVRVTPLCEEVKVYV